jgi:hypothetical protein
MVELSSKFGCDTGEAVDLILEAFRIGLVVDGLSFEWVRMAGDGVFILAGAVPPRGWRSAQRAEAGPGAGGIGSQGGRISRWTVPLASRLRSSAGQLVSPGLRLPLQITHSKMESG